MVDFFGDYPAWTVALALVSFIYIGVIFPSAAFVSYIERKLGAGLQARVGPNRAGPGGIFQPFADSIKMLQKENEGNLRAGDRVIFFMITVALFSTVAVLPLGSLLLLVDTEMSAFIPFWSTLILVFGVMLLRFREGSVSGWFGGLRVSTQALSGMFSALIAVLCAGIQSGGFRWTEMVQSQGFAPWSWRLVDNPFQFLAFCVFILSGMVLLSVPPLDSGLSLQDPFGSKANRLSGIKAGLFRLSRFYGVFLWIVMAVVLFCGGWKIPEFMFSWFQQSESLLLLQFLELAVLLSKVFLIMGLIFWVAKVNPRLRADQITDLTWKVLAPLALTSLIGVVLISYWGVAS